MNITRAKLTGPARVVVALTALLWGLVVPVRSAFGNPSGPHRVNPVTMVGSGPRAYASSGYGLSVDPAVPLTPPAGCSRVATGDSAAMAAVAVAATGGSTTSRLTVGSSSWKVPANKAFSTVAWVPLTSGSFAACVPPRLAAVSMQLLAHTVTPSAATPGGRVELSARIRLATHSGPSGSLIFPEDSTPPGAAGVFLQVSSPTAGTVQLSAGSASLHVVVGRGLPAETVVLPGTSVAWSSTSGAAPTVLLLGAVTQTDDDVTGGSLVNLLASPVTLSGTTIAVAGTGGIPAVGSQVPATGVLANITGYRPAVEDPLGAGRRTWSGAVGSRPTESLLRLGVDGAIHLTAAATATVVAWLGGDVVYGPSTVDLTLPGAPQPSAMPADNELSFAGSPGFQAGQTLIVGVTPYTPSGAIDIVDSVASAGGTTTVTVSPGGLLDAFNALNLVSQIRASTPAQAGPSGSSAGNDATTRPQPTAPNLGITRTLDFHISKGFTLGTNPSVRGSLSLNFAPTLTVAINVNVGWSPSVGLHYALDTTTALSAAITAQGSWRTSTGIPLGTYYLPAFDLGPVVIVPELSSDLELSAGISGSVTVGASISEHTHDGFTLAAGGGRAFTNQGDPNNGLGVPRLSGGPETSVQASADAKVTLTFTLAMYGVAGPYAQASAELGVTVNPASTPVWQVTAAADFSIGMNLDAMDLGPLDEILRLLGLPTSPNWSLGHDSYVIAQGGTPTPTGGNSGGGGSGSGVQGPTGGGGPGGAGGSGGYSSAPPGANVTVSQGGAAPYGYRYLIALTGFTPNTSIQVACYDSQDPNGFYWFPLTVDASGDATTQSYCYSAAGPNYWVVAGGLRSNLTQWGSGPGSGNGGAVTVGWSAAHPGWVTMTARGFAPGSYTYTCDFGSGGDASYTVHMSDSPETFDNGQTCYDLQGGDTVGVTIGSATSNTLTVGGEIPSKGYTETTGGVTDTWSDFSDAGGTEGPTVASNTSVVVTCAVQGFPVADGNTWWYQIETAPWSNEFYASADAFYNDGQTQGSLLGTPFVDANVPRCSTPPPPPNTWSETTGGNANTWTNYTDAGGYQGPTIPAYSTVQITCALQGFRVADGNTWWYQIASPPWSNQYFVSADAFYNDGQTSGSLIGTPFVDPAVAQCGGGLTEWTGGATNTWTNYSDAGGTQGPTIGGNSPVNVACAVPGFPVADGNTWWYRISSPPWSNQYYASADAFYNNGQTSGSLIGTPFVDPNVPRC